MGIWRHFGGRHVALKAKSASPDAAQWFAFHWPGQSSLRVCLQQNDRCLSQWPGHIFVAAPRISFPSPSTNRARRPGRVPSAVPIGWPRLRRGINIPLPAPGGRALHAPLLRHGGRRPPVRGLAAVPIGWPRLRRARYLLPRPQGGSASRAPLLHRHGGHPRRGVSPRLSPKAGRSCNRKCSLRAVAPAWLDCCQGAGHACFCAVL